VPVLFVPGNSGSKKQARSIAAEAARHAARTSARVRLEIYVSGFGGELSAFDTSVLAAQADFVQQCLQWLAHKYASHNQTAFIVGHSMGAPCSDAPMRWACSAAPCQTRAGVLASASLPTLLTQHPCCHNGNTPQVAWWRA
jgi:PGAP1-like protein